MPEQVHFDVDRAVLEAFSPFVDARHRSLLRVVRSAFDYASVESSSTEGEAAARTHIIIDRRALAKAMFIDGVGTAERGSSTAWLATWLSEEMGINPWRLPEAGPERLGQSTAVEYFKGGLVRTSISLKEVVLPGARDLAKRTTGRGMAHLRHVVFALLDDLPLAWFGPDFTAEHKARLRSDFIARNAQIYEAEADAWRAEAEAGPPPSAPALSVRTLPDAPAEIDGLGRKAFAQVLVKRMREIEAGRTKDEFGRTIVNDGTDASFIFHLDGAWGAGKSSVLNFAKAELRKQPAWLVIDFNAWRHQTRKPPWWPLIAVVHDARIGIDAAIVRLWWRLRMDWAPQLTALALLTLAGVLAWFALAGSDEESARSAVGLAGKTSEILIGLMALAVALTGFLALVRGQLHGSSRNAELYLETRREPFGKIVHHFRCLIREIGRPVAIFIDDLDRCDAAYVVELLEGIQTLLRSAPVVYVVAGDRKWICSSFQKRYADYCDKIGEPGRPLGYLFLDKVFQLSTTIPKLSDERRKLYWSQLLKAGDSDPSTAEAQRQTLESAAEAQAARDVAHLTQQEQFQQAIDEAEGDPLRQEALRTAIAKQISSPRTVDATEHRLALLAHLLEANPRAMKRLVNAYGLNHARAVLEGRDVNVEALARWTIIELRWPLLADHFVDNWASIANGKLAPEAFPPPIRELLANADVASVIGTADEPGALTIGTLNPILG